MQFTLARLCFLCYTREEETTHTLKKRKMRGYLWNGQHKVS
ncbi:gp113 [Brochothrix phage A9]|uniref:Gp113 n=1 Tax=Brochothrix phage A9 TaxID=857312 RepID=D9J0R0_9CAUD|nr:gp113 [Brochothrix phage A9]ADJ53147.1 gp113 [Brochothrix phage A9]